MKAKLISLCLALALCMSLAIVPAWAASPAQLSAQSFSVDGRPVSAEIYNIGGNNYFKLRDIAMLLRDTDARFSVDYDAATGVIRLITGGTYIPDGSELKPGADRSATCVPSMQKLVIDGAGEDIAAYNLGGNNFFKLRELGSALGFYVGYDQDANTAVVNSSYRIVRTDYSEGLPVVLCFEKPRFNGDSDVLRGIEEEFDKLERTFAANEVPDKLDMVREFMTEMPPDYGPSAEHPFYDEWSAAVFTCTDDLISVGIGFYWFMGGVSNYGLTGYNFSGETGSVVRLNDVQDGTAEEIRESVVEALYDQYPDIGEAALVENVRDTILAYGIDEFNFYVKDGSVHVLFAQYELTAGYYGVIDVVLPQPARTVGRG